MSVQMRYKYGPIGGEILWHRDNIRNLAAMSVEIFDGWENLGKDLNQQDFKKRRRNTFFLSVNGEQAGTLKVSVRNIYGILNGLFIDAAHLSSLSSSFSKLRLDEVYGVKFKFSFDMDFKKAKIIESFTLHSLANIIISSVLHFLSVSRWNRYSFFNVPLVGNDGIVIAEPSSCLRYDEDYLLNESFYRVASLFASVSTCVMTHASSLARSRGVSVTPTDGRRDALVEDFILNLVMPSIFYTLFSLHAAIKKKDEWKKIYGIKYMLGDEVLLNKHDILEASSTGRNYSYVHVPASKQYMHVIASYISLFDIGMQETDKETKILSDIMDTSYRKYSSLPILPSSIPSIGNSIKRTKDIGTDLDITVGYYLANSSDDKIGALIIPMLSVVTRNVVIRVMSLKRSVFVSWDGGII